MVTSVVPSTTSMLDVGPVKVKDVGGMVVKVVDEVERLFAGVEVEPAKKLCNGRNTDLDFTLNWGSLSETLPESYDKNDWRNSGGTLRQN